MNKFYTRAGHTERCDSILEATEIKSNQVHFADFVSSSRTPATAAAPSPNARSILTVLHVVKIFVFFSGPMFCLMDLTYYFFGRTQRRTSVLVSQMMYWPLVIWHAKQTPKLVSGISKAKVRYEAMQCMGRKNYIRIKSYKTNV